MKLNSVALIGGGADLVCDDCLPEARREHSFPSAVPGGTDTEIVSVALVDVSDESCGYCGIGDPI